ncbi:MAG: hypothetical protein WD336_03260 [Trueperaceae bacterium]
MTDATSHDDLETLLRTLRDAVRGGGVAHVGFLDEAASAELLAASRKAGVAASAWGGRPAAERRVVTARPDGVPEATPRLSAAYLPGVHDPSAAIAALRRGAGVTSDRLGDVLPHLDGVSVIVHGDLPEGWGEALASAVRGGPAETVPIERVAAGSRKELRLVVPSLRADVVGAKAFGASRAWFTKGVAGGKVRIDGRTVGKAGALELGSELWAEGLGRARVLAVEGETKRGNRKVRIEVERP